MHSDKIDAEKFWQFSLSFYQEPNVASVLLNGQEQLQANVNLALLCLYTQQNKQPLSLPVLSQLHQVVMDFSRQFTKPLRQLRSDFKRQQTELQSYSDIRRHLLDAELILEQQEQTVLVNLIHQIMKEKDVFENIDRQAFDNIGLYQTMLLQNSALTCTPSVDLRDLNQHIGSI